MMGEGESIAAVRQAGVDIYFYSAKNSALCSLWNRPDVSRWEHNTNRNKWRSTFRDWQLTFAELMLLAVSTARCMLQGLRCSHIEGKSKRHRTTKHRKEIKRSNTFPLSLCLCVCSHYMLSFYLARNARTCNICLPYTALVRFVCILLDMR